MVEVSVVVPVVNYEKKIKKNLLKIISYLKKNKKIKKFEVIASVQKSNDKTLEVCKSIQEVRTIYSKKKGKWQGIKNGAKRAKYNKVFFLDSDLSYPVELLDKAVKYWDFDVIIGSRYVSKSISKKIPLRRKIISFGFRSLVRILFQIKQKDIQVGCKIVDKKLLLKVKDNKWIGDTELLYISKRKGLKIKEIPISYNHEVNELRVFSASITMFFDLIKLRFRI